MTPWGYDDFNYGAGDGGPGTMFAAQVQEYRSWSGKFAGHFMARVLLHGPAWLHPLLTSVIFTDLVFSGMLLSLGGGGARKSARRGRLWRNAVMRFPDSFPYSPPVE